MFHLIAFSLELLDLQVYLAKQVQFFASNGLVIICVWCWFLCFSCPFYNFVGSCICFYFSCGKIMRIFTILMTFPLSRWTLVLHFFRRSHRQKCTVSHADNLSNKYTLTYIRLCETSRFRWELITFSIMLSLLHDMNSN